MGEGERGEREARREGSKSEAQKALSCCGLHVAVLLSVINLFLVKFLFTFTISLTAREYKFSIMFFWYFLASHVSRIPPLLRRTAEPAIIHEWGNSNYIRERNPSEMRVSWARITRYQYRTLHYSSTEKMRLASECRHKSSNFLPMQQITLIFVIFFIFFRRIARMAWCTLKIQVLLCFIKKFKCS